MAAKKEILQLKLGERIADLRKSRGLNQTELGFRCNKDRQSINRLENGKINPSFFYLYQVANALEVSLEEMFDFELK